MKKLYKDFSLFDLREEAKPLLDKQLEQEKRNRDAFFQALGSSNKSTKTFKSGCDKARGYGETTL